MESVDIGLIGLAVMGQNLVLNMLDHGKRVGVYNRSTQKVDAFVKQTRNENLVPTYSVQELAAQLSSPKKIMLMVQAGQVVDDLIDQILPLFSPGDIIIDGGNSLYSDTERRVQRCKEHEVLYLGMGVSGGEEGARHGPSLMPGGNAKAWPAVQDIFQAISAKVGNDPCCQWVGEGGAGHYVKMVHNGIEYGDMQLICEAYHLMRVGLGMEVEELADIFDHWNSGVLDSYLIEITRDVLRVKDSDGEPMVDKIVDSAGQKGTGKWTGINALELGTPLTLIGEAVFARFLSALTEERKIASDRLPGPDLSFSGDKRAMIDAIHDALYASKIISYTQGFMLMRQADQIYKWNLNFGDIALMWRGGCIIRSVFLGDIKKAYDDESDMSSLLLAGFFNKAITQAQTGWRTAVGMSIQMGIPAPAFCSALAFYDGYRHERLPANLLQAQRDYFGAHTYERVDKPRGEFFHTDWIGGGTQ